MSWLQTTGSTVQCCCFPWCSTKWKHTRSDCMPCWQPTDQSDLEMFGNLQEDFCWSPRSAILTQGHKRRIRVIANMVLPMQTHIHMLKTYIDINQSTYLYIYPYIYIYMSICLYVNPNKSLYIYKYVSMFVCMCYSYKRTHR